MLITLAKHQLNLVDVPRSADKLKEMEALLPIGLLLRAVRRAVNMSNCTGINEGYGE